MNTILQKRIEEAAHQYIQSDAVAPENMQLAFGDFINGAKWMLNNLWISVEEALPEEDIPNCFVAYKTFDMVFYSTGSYEKDNDEWYVDGVGFNVKVTHYMPIPSLEGGEK